MLEHGLPRSAVKTRVLRERHARCARTWYPPVHTDAMLTTGLRLHPPGGSSPLQRFWPPIDAESDRGGLTSAKAEAYGNWRPGTVTKIGRSGSVPHSFANADGDTDERAFPTDLMRPAEGLTLVAVHGLRRGLVVMPTDGDATVADVLPGQRRYRSVVYTDGSRAEVSAQALMRVGTRPPAGGSGGEGQPSSAG